MYKDECITLDKEDNVTGHANKYVEDSPCLWHGRGVGGGGAGGAEGSDATQSARRIVVRCQVWCGVPSTAGGGSSGSGGGRSASRRCSEGC